MKTYLFAALLLATPASAADFTAVITDLSGAAITERAANGAESQVTLRQLCVNALLSSYPDEPNLPAADKVKRFKLALLITEKAEVAISVEEAAEIKKLVAKLYGPLVVGRVWQLLDPGSVR